MSLKQKSLGSIIRSARLKAKLTQQQLADLARCHRLSVVKIEHDITMPGIRLIRKLASALGIDSKEIL